ncbi:hypothetical protein BS47DRAFT_1382326 [Hydnum rufescens UP504]|uniref:DUF6534 domain-containing protein n=1 Tax=Hydnum rufescens UP504 TaxID=1448309 RepID=A0A9P6AYF9_9AGAM|nr:hypothetical protein BS47DRAFT_1382326 [Hydnum rufescens UP504]
MDATQFNIFSGSFFGNLLTAICFGVLTIQTSSYYHAFPNDGRSVKLVVGFLWTLEAFQLACVTGSLYGWFVTNSHDPLARAAWDFTIFQVSAVCASVTVQTFFAHRVYSLSTNLYLGALVQVLVLVQFGFGVGQHSSSCIPWTLTDSVPIKSIFWHAAATAVRSNTVLTFEALVREWRWLAVSWVAMQAIADIVIATCMCLLLRRRRTGFQMTDSTINRMVLYTISTGLVTSVLSCILLGVFARYGFDFTVFAICMPLGGFYSVTMLANLHTRKGLRARLDTPNPLELIGSSIKERMGGIGGIIAMKGGSRLQG